MPRKVTPANSLDELKRAAKRWLTALRENIDDAHARFERVSPNLGRAPTLRDVQHALARELGFTGWSALKEHATTTKPVTSDAERLVSRFLDNACPDHHVRGGPDHLRARHTAMRLLERHPEIAHANIYTEIVCGDIDRVERALKLNSALANTRQPGASTERAGAGGSGDLIHSDLGPKGWEPLLYLCFTRLPLAASNDNALEIARALLDRGADPKAFFMAGSSRYTPLVGAIGEGEEGRPAHPRRDELVRLLLERGADPFDMQVTYNIYFHGEVLWWLRVSHEYSIKAGLKAEWGDPEWSMIDMGGYGKGARWYLEIAIRQGDVELARWCLEHGASPNASPGSPVGLPKDSLYQVAMAAGELEIGDLLLEHGSTVNEVSGTSIDAFRIACFSLRHQAVRQLVRKHPELLQSTDVLFRAARRDRADIVELLLDEGMSPDLANDRNERALHIAAYNNAMKVARLLLERGAEVDPVEANYSNTPLGAAVYYQNRTIIDLLSRHSHDLWELTFAGKLDRLRRIFADEPDRARIEWEGNTPLMWIVPDDESLAISIARLYLAYGVDAAKRNQDGITAADRAERLGMVRLAELLRAESTRPVTRTTIDQYERMATTLLEAYRSGSREAMERHWKDAGHRRTWAAMRRYIQLGLGKTAESEEGSGVSPGDPRFDITLGDARSIVARAHGFETWTALTDAVTAEPFGDTPKTRLPIRFLPDANDSPHSSRMRTYHWHLALDVLAQQRIPGLDANGQMTDDLLERLSRIDHITTLRLGGSRALTDEGVRHLPRMPQLKELDLSGTAVTDAALEVLRALPALERLNLSMTAITDLGAAHLAACDALESVNLTGTATGDGAVRALAGKERLRHFQSGQLLSDAGMPLFHELPVFKIWHGVNASLGMFATNPGPNCLVLRGTFTDRGMHALAGLDGLFGLNVDDRALALSEVALRPLMGLPRLGFLAFDATDRAMPLIAAMPALRMLMCQDTTAGDDGFAALGLSRSIEYIWGRRCHNLSSRGFAALSAMPALRGLSVSCRNVDDAGLSTLPTFPALRELMPMDIPDAGYRYIGQCRDLESLVLMYCRDTTDAATEYITGLKRLTKYFASYTQITDQTPKLLSGITSLEDVTFSGCARLTNVGIATLARLPRLRKLQLSEMRHVSREVVSAFGPEVEIDYSL